MSLQEGEVPLEYLSRPYYLHVTARGIRSFRVLVQALLLAYHCKRGTFLYIACPGSTTCMSLQEGDVPLEGLSRLYYLHVTARGIRSFRVLVQALLLACHCKRDTFLESPCPGSTTCMSLQEGEVPLECLSRLYYLHVTARGRSSFRVHVQALLLACHCKREKFL